MDNKELQFKTNLNCGGCVAKVKPGLDSAVGASNWSVDTDNPEKTLTVNAKGITEEEIIAIVKSKGFTAEAAAQ